MRYNIRVELPSAAGNRANDITVDAPTLTFARDKAENRIRETYKSLVVSTFDWRGQVVFVNCGPAEDSRRIPIVRYPLGAMFHPRSLKQAQTVS